MLMLCELNEVDEFTLFDIAIVNDNRGCTALHFLTELCVVLLLDLNQRVGLLCDLTLTICLICLRVLEDIRV